MRKLVERKCRKTRSGENQSKDNNDEEKIKCFRRFIDVNNFGAFYLKF